MKPSKPQGARKRRACARTVPWLAAALAAAGLAGFWPAAAEDPAPQPGPAAEKEDLKDDDDPAEPDPADTEKPEPADAPAGEVKSSNPYAGALATEIKGTGDPATEDPVTHTPYEGYGDPPKGAAGDKTIEVTNLDDDGPGSLRAACKNASGAKIVFKIGGTINIKTGIMFNATDATLAGETAPEPGITIDARGIADPQGNGLAIRGENLIVRHLRVRNSPAENMEIIKGKRILIDHCSSTFCGDGAIDVDQGSNLIISWCLIAGAVEASRSHGHKASWHHNLFTENNRRNPKIMGEDANPFDYRNNVVQNWHNYGIRIEGGAAGNMVCNWFSRSPNARRSSKQCLEIKESAGEWYVAGNKVPGYDVDSLSKKKEPYEEPRVTTLDPEAARKVVLEKAGAHPRDQIDLGYIEGRTKGSRAEGGSLPPAADAPKEGGAAQTKPAPPKDPREALREAQKKVDDAKRAFTSARGAERKEKEQAYKEAMEELRKLQKAR